MDLSSGLLLLIVGLIAGGYGTIVGAGGGFIFVPALLLFFDMEPAYAAGSGLVIVLINSLSGVYGYAKQKKINYRIGMNIVIGAVPGSLLGVWLLQLQPSDSKIFYWIFATILLALGIFLLIKNSPIQLKIFLKTDSETPEKDIPPILKSKWFVPLGLLMGVLSSYLGIGGGWLLVPILIYLFYLPTHQATATSIFTLSLYTTVGVISQLLYGSIDWPAVIWGGIGVFIGAQLGVYLSKKIPGKIVMQMLSALLIIIGIRMYF
ncbi:sulfite exporter TauE/SafE family protein [Aquibacillus sp. 3ASR75-11]|uniref:Probable membrane transporter protein n=1 Tax=Terrihalobacillus insolitus TaxID=2950438 RepID=A0A9X3WQ88_9BACI|nr:sulfite exporter TauE/SafE family protein [Terrihalobacillus insolitus]MDC3412082.1 sulfite exporter TauE/SafE family protein [Terrihalobacillus insolitus]MDC3423225.1 sulfite exporter TauE/SafE family protein [Terrihalobacillus insolitus]